MSNNAPAAAGRRAVLRLAAAAAREGPSGVAGQHFLRPELVIPESV